MIWDQLTTLDFEALDRKIPVILILSATEQHGPHLPLATDRMIGEHFAHRLNRRIPKDILILPVMSIGCSEHHMDFLGSLTITHETFLAQVTDIVKAVVAHGFTNVVLLNSHGGNQGIGQVLVEKLGAIHKQVNMVFVTWWKLVGDLYKLNDGGAMSTGHAGEFETSLMLLIAPQLVKDHSFEKGRHTNTFTWAESDMLNPSKVSLYRSMKEMTTNGVFGDPTHATKEKGEQITELVIKNLMGIIQDLRNT